MAPSRAHDYGKGQVVDDVPKVIKELHFGVLSNQDVINQSTVELADRRIYDFDQGDGRKVAQHGPLDKRMGVSSKNDECATCKRPFQTCNGHFGHVRLVLPVFHVGYFKKTIQILQSICKVWFNLQGDDRPDTDSYRIARVSSSLKLIAENS